MEKIETTRFTPLQLRNGKVLRNRIIIPPMASGTADQDGYVTPKTLAHYQRLSEAQPGLLIVEYTSVHPSGKSEDNQLGIQSDVHISGLSTLAKTIQNSGALAGLQITHSGGKTERELTGGILMGPSDIAVPVKDRHLEKPIPMSSQDILLWKTAFAQAIARADHAGFDLVEFHAAHGYGLNQWISPITNHRTDSYGVGLLGRLKLLTEIISDARLKYPHLLFSVRIPGQDFSENGLTVADSIQISQKLEEIGVDLIHVSSGIGGWRRPGSRIGEGYFLEEAAEIQAAVNIPVIVVGGIHSGAFIDHGLQNGKFSLAAVGRSIAADPNQWRELNLEISKESMQCQL